MFPSYSTCPRNETHRSGAPVVRGMNSATSSLAVGQVHIVTGGLRAEMNIERGITHAQRVDSSVLLAHIRSPGYIGWH